MVYTSRYRLQVKAMSHCFWLCALHSRPVSYVVGFSAVKFSVKLVPERSNEVVSAREDLKPSEIIKQRLMERMKLYRGKI